jgi:hypothetical protein
VKALKVGGDRLGPRRTAGVSGQADDPFQGMVLMDNTTLFGARRAFEWQPVSPGRLPSGVDLRSLMDVLEAVVLFNDFAVDCSSREGQAAWTELSRLSRAAGSFFHDVVITPDRQELVAALIEASTAQLGDLLASGELDRHLGFLPSSREVDVLPPQYRDSNDFFHFAVEGMRGNTPSGRAAGGRLAQLVRVLDAQDPAVRNFAYFAYRGFYYQQLAHAVSASYMPHTWRSALIRSRLGNPSVPQFTNFVLDETGKIRELLRLRINEEFGAPTLTADFPLIASYVMGQCTTRAGLLETAVQVRSTAKATAFRKWASDIERKVRDQEDLPGIRQAQDELNIVIHELKRELGLSRRNKQEITVKLGVPLVSAETTAHVPSPAHWVSRVIRRRTHLVFLRDLARESTRLAPFALAFQRLAP